MKTLIFPSKDNNGKDITFVVQVHDGLLSKEICFQDANISFNEKKEYVKGVQKTWTRDSLIATMLEGGDSTFFTNKLEIILEEFYSLLKKAYKDKNSEIELNTFLNKLYRKKYGDEFINLINREIRKLKRLKNKENE